MRYTNYSRYIETTVFVGGWIFQLNGICSYSTSQEQAPRHSMLRHLTSKIKATGPISVAEYMREVLTNPVMVESVLDLMYTCC